MGTTAESRPLYVFEMAGKAGWQQLTLEQRAALLGVSPRHVAPAVRLAPGSPVFGTASLTLFSPVLVEPDPLFGNDTALFNSVHVGASAPGAAVAFQQFRAGAKHLVEFEVKLGKLGWPYRFELTSLPGEEIEEIEITEPQPLAVVVRGNGGVMTRYGAKLLQQKEAFENAPWALRAVRITTIR
jgi:hypothetical protein